MKKKVVGIDGNTYVWDISGDIVNIHEHRKTSELHKKARMLLYETYPTTVILEEVPVKLTEKGRTVFFDYFIPHLNTAVEVHGQQHYKFSSLFHSSAQDFIKQKQTDNNKRTFCEDNGIRFIELPYNEDIEQWTQRII